MNSSRKDGDGNSPTFRSNPDSPFARDGLSRLLDASQNAPAAKLHVGPKKDGKFSMRVELPVLTRFTLQRDEDRPLQFDGTELASIESRGTPVVHRAAVYRTIGGKFVAEFSSSPNPNGVYKDPPRSPTGEELFEYRESLISWVTAAAEWREGNAEKHPRDHRDLASAQALRNLATKLDVISVRDNRWTVLWWADYNLSDELSAQEKQAIALRQAERKDGLIRGYGFYSDPPVVHPDLEAHSFLDRLINEIEAAAQPRDAAPASGRAEAFDSLENALAFFRPGKLTNELLRKLGRWGPEFID
jgi:hypothetical protein